MEEFDNMGIWSRVSEPPPHALKKIGGGRLKGMTDINPQWRYRALTEVFGPCGTGWGYSPPVIRMEPGHDGEVACFAELVFWWVDDNGLKAEVPGVGGSMFVAKESSGLRTNDEAVKMAVTDALSVALKALGFGAAIYEGRWDGSKYAPDRDAVPAQKSAQSAPQAPSRATEEEGRIVAEIEDWLSPGVVPDVAAFIRSDGFKDRLRRLRELNEQAFERLYERARKIVKENEA